MRQVLERENRRRMVWACVALAVFVMGCSQEPRAEVALPGLGVVADFDWALESEGRARVQRLEAYVTAYSPDTNGFEDAVHVRYYRLAQYELLRVYYSEGLIESAEEVLEQLKGTDADVR